jgi:hypothetical protein
VCAYLARFHACLAKKKRRVTGFWFMLWPVASANSVQRRLMITAVKSSCCVVPPENASTAS